MCTVTHRNIFHCVLFVDLDYVSGGTFNTSEPYQFWTPIWTFLDTKTVVLEVLRSLLEVLEQVVGLQHRVLDHQDGRVTLLEYLSKSTRKCSSVTQPCSWLTYHQTRPKTPNEHLLEGLIEGVTDRIRWRIRLKQCFTGTHEAC